MSDFKSKYGSWALITGASAGLGETFAKRLAAKGLNLILTARRKDRLESLAQELEREFGIETKIVAVDLGAPDFLPEIKACTDDLDVGLLINNAGFTNSGEFLDNALEDEILLVDVNIRAAMILAHHFGSLMREKRKGGIIFSASIGGHAPIPYWSNYAASKAYDLFLAEGLASELKPFGVDVLGLCPGATRTEFYNYSGIIASLITMGPEAVVDHAIRNLGRKNSSVVGLLNSLMVLGFRFFPRRLAIWMAGKAIRDMAEK